MNYTFCMPVVLLATSLTSCGSATPDPAPPIQTAAPARAVAVLPPPAPPKCEALAENCAAEDGKWAKIPASEMVIAPVPGWIYAQGQKLTISQQGDAGPCLAVTGHEVPDPRKIDKVYPVQLEALAGELDIHLGKASVKWKQPDKLPGGKVALSQWIVRAVKRGETGGDLLIVATQPQDGKAVFGVAFVPDGDDADAAKVLASFATLQSPEDPSPY
jgi:hypothetical protein